MTSLPTPQTPGHRRAVDDETFGLLVTARIASNAGDYASAVENGHQALERLCSQGHSTASAMLAVFRVRGYVADEAVRMLFDLGLCTDIAAHADYGWRVGPFGAITCARCGGRRPERGRPE